MTPRIFPPGRYVYLWERGESDYKRFEPTPAFCDTLIAHDQTGVIVHSVEPVPESSTEASEFCTPARVAAFNARGIRVVIGIGFRGPSNWRAIATAIIKAIDACKRADSPCDGCNCDYEGSWNGFRDVMKQLLQMVLDAHPDAGLYITMPCWWAPERLPTHADGTLGGCTWPNFPTREFIDVMDPSIPIDPQCYGAGHEGSSKGMLAWARAPYWEHYQMAGWRIVPSVQMYHRSLLDHLDLLLSEPTVNQWDYLEADSVCLHANRIAHVLRLAGIVGSNWVVLFQRAYGLTADGTAGPLTLAKLATVCA